MTTAMVCVVISAQGDADAQFNLGSFYRYGKSVAQDFATARLWYERAAAQGDSDARQALRELGRG